MFPFDFFRSFLPLHNPLGFGASDFILLAFALLLAAAAVLWTRFRPQILRLARNTRWSILLLALLPVALRLGLLPGHPVPTPDVYDEFGHLLVADTLRNLRLANPPHSMHQFFETQFVLQEPTYSSIYPIGQGLVIAIGWTLFGRPWAGVVLAVAALCALTYWMLRAWMTPGWALAGGVLAVIELGPLTYWMNSYWGGAAAAVAGCLVFGALPRIQSDSMRAPLLLGTGLGLHLLIRPFESIALLLSAILYFAPQAAAFLLRGPATRKHGRTRGLAWRLLFASTPVLLALALTLLHNKAVTGSWTTLPYALSRYEYGVPGALTFESNPVPHRELNREQALNYKMQLSFRGLSFLQRLEYRVRYYRFFFLAPLYLLSVPAFLWRLREYRFAWVVLAVGLFVIGSNFYPNFEPHYIAAAAPLFILISVVGLEQWMRLSPEAGRLIGFLCVAQFVFWYGMHVFESQPFSLAIRRYETWNNINEGNPAGRIAVRQQLANISGKLLVFVRYYPQHPFQQEWVYNSADIDGSRIVWARDLGSTENRKLLAYYKDRSAWLLEPDFRPPRLRPYRPD